MDKISFDYSTKNTPCTKKKNYLAKLIEKTEKLIRNMRWRAHAYLHPESMNQNRKETYGFNSRRAPPVIEELKDFECRMTELISNVEFEQRRNDFQSELSKDIKKINGDDHLIVKADKTTNYYRMEPGQYNELLNKNIQKSYKKAQKTQEDKINKEAKEISERLDLSDRIDIMAKRDAFITLKDHKPNFTNSPTCRLISPTKSEIGRISKQILQKIVKNVATATKVNLWRNTQSVLEWFNGIKEKQTAQFICFDIVDFYPSITEKLLAEAIEFAANYTNIPPEEINIITHAKQNLLYSGETPWVKKSGLFDVTMGSYDGAETCELIVVYMLTHLKPICGNDIGLYRDDGLAVSHDTPQMVETAKKKICAVFSEKGLKITIEANKKVINYLDVTLNLNNGKHQPYMKPGNTPSYVHAKSNHPPEILKRIPESINQRLSDISSDEREFNNAAPPYQAALKKSGYEYKLHFAPKDRRNKRRRKRTRNITWFNPPFDAKVKTNLGREFLKIVRECFPRRHVLHAIFNRNTLKLSYSCMPNVKSIISAHNKNLIKPNTEDPSQNLCNCRKKAECPLDNQCLAKGIVYQATVTSGNNESVQTYVGLTDTTFKARLANHKQSFIKENQRNQTELSKHIWHLKEEGANYQVTWKILGKARAYTNVTKTCNLCNLEKFFIICHSDLASLNKRSELISTCRHARKFLIKNG